MANRNPVQVGPWFGKGHAPAPRKHQDHEHKAAEYVQSLNDYLSGDMRPSEIRQVLADLNFKGRSSVPLELDRDCRDYLLRRLQAK